MNPNNIHEVSLPDLAHEYSHLYQANRRKPHATQQKAKARPSRTPGVILFNLTRRKTIPRAIQESGSLHMRSSPSMNRPLDHPLMVKRRKGNSVRERSIPTMASPPWTETHALWDPPNPLAHLNTSIGIPVPQKSPPNTLPQSQIPPAHPLTYGTIKLSTPQATNSAPPGVSSKCSTGREQTALSKTLIPGKDHRICVSTLDG